MLKLDLSGKKAVITGATGQLGRTISRTLASCGAEIVLCYHGNRAKAEELKEKIESESGVRAFPVQVDIRDKASVFAMRDRVLQEMGAPEIVVNAAVSQLNGWKSVIEEPLESYQDQFETTMLHHVIMAKAFLPSMIEKQYGRFIGINTECSAKCAMETSAYSAGKRGMDGIYRVLAKEVGKHGITVNQVAPGWTRGDAIRDSIAAGTRNEAEFADYVQAVPLRRQGTDVDIANAVAFLASDLASYITGLYLPVSGGNIMPAI